jgi:solute carrier family 25 carnitine/acylcarnitine transporter 20/29
VKSSEEPRIAKRSKGSEQERAGASRSEEEQGRYEAIEEERTRCEARIGPADASSQGWSVLVLRGDAACLSQCRRALVHPPSCPRDSLRSAHRSQMSPLLGIAAVNSLLFTAYGASRRIVSPFPDLTVPQIALAGSMAGAANAVLASPVGAECSSDQLLFRPLKRVGAGSIPIALPSWQSRSLSQRFEEMLTDPVIIRTSRDLP